MTGMRCDGCGHIRQYLRPVVVVRDDVAVTTTEKTPPKNEVGVRRFHERCYEAARKADPSLPLADRADAASPPGGLGIEGSVSTVKDARLSTQAPCRASA